MKYDFLIVGAGLAGVVLAERIANTLNRKVLLIEKRNHIAGNVYDYMDDSGILVHKYGPHIFHTSSKKVWDYLSQFTEWSSYEHRVVAMINGKEVPVPFNLTSIELCFEKEKSDRLKKLLIEKYGMESKIPILKLRQSNDIEIQELAEFIYQNVFLGYNLKQWNLRPEELDFNVSSRVPVFISYDDRYFQDTYQAMPKDGYTELVKKMINNENITLKLNCEFKDIINQVEFDELVFTGPIDSYFDYKFGKLPYRSLEFEFENLAIEYFQSKAQVNYPNDNDFTRITEFKHFYNTQSNNTIIAKEYSKEFIIDLNEPYYPIPKSENSEIFNKYNKLAQEIENVHFIGRLAEYKYYNMDQIVGVALQYFEKNFA